MRTPEEIYVEANKRADDPNNSGKTITQLKQDVIDFLKQIQTESFNAGVKKGMLDAAGIVRTFVHPDFGTTALEARENFQRQILSAAEKL